ncbi:macrolide transporter ATP-binding /permease protein [Chitinispirillum alkaliphilum]|nr:macrolide transporter ATP-binding /permease protein [Chitinispirillum alkaliphilum]
MTPVIETINLNKSYRLGKQEVPVLKNVNFKVNQGDYVAIMGHSGAGKSTLLNILGCLDIPSSGEYRITGTEISTLSQNQLAEIRSTEIGFVFQNFNLLPKLNLYLNVELPLIYGNVNASERKPRIERVLKMLDIWDRRHHKPNELSGGQKQRAAIARALVKKPSIILADEPTGNLDSHTTGEILNVFSTLHSEGNTILVITHEDEVAAKAQRTIRLDDGRIVG